MKSSRRHLFNSHGFSMIELLLVIGVIAILAVAIFIAYPAAKDRNIINVENQRIYRIVGTIRNLYAGVPGYGGLNLDAANAAKAFPSEMNNGNNAAGQVIKNSWGGGVFVGVDPVDSRQFFISYQDVPAQSCVLLGVGSLSNFQKIEIPTGTVIYEKSSQSEADIGAITTACTADPSGLTEIRFTTY